MGGKGTPLFIWICWSLWLGGALGTTRALLAASFPLDPAACLWSALVYALYAIQIHRWLRRIGSFRWATAVLYPIAALFFIIVFLRSLTALVFRQPLVWKGRTNQ
jgi:4,4'-diaponeurosporenoate glycosyltransferase